MAPQRVVPRQRVIRRGNLLEIPVISKKARQRDPREQLPRSSRVLEKVTDHSPGTYYGYDLEKSASVNDVTHGEPQMFRPSISVPTSHTVTGSKQVNLTSPESHPTVMDITMLSIGRDRTMLSSWPRKALHSIPKMWKSGEDVSMISAGRPMMRDTTMWDLEATYNPSSAPDNNDNLQDGMDISTIYFQKPARVQGTDVEATSMEDNHDDIGSEALFDPDIRPNKRSTTRDDDSMVLPRKRRCLTKETTESAAMWIAPSPSSLGNLAKLAVKPRLKSRKILQRNLRPSGW